MKLSSVQREIEMAEERRRLKEAWNEKLSEKQSQRGELIKATMTEYPQLDRLMAEAVVENYLMNPEDTPDDTIRKYRELKESENKRQKQ